MSMNSKGTAPSMIHLRVITAGCAIPESKPRARTFIFCFYNRKNLILLDLNLENVTQQILKTFWSVAQFQMVCFYIISLLEFVHFCCLFS